MASSSDINLQSNTNTFFENLRGFPPVIDGRINLKRFLEASMDLVALIDRLGKVFAPAKYDIQGNIDKIKRSCVFDDKSCLLELMLDEISKKEFRITEAVLWLNRAFLFFELFFQEIIVCLESNDYDTPSKKLFIVAYEGSIKKYHNWVTQQIFALICKMSPTLRQLIRSIEAEDDIKKFESILTTRNIALHIVRCKIDDFFNEYNLFEETT